MGKSKWESKKIDLGNVINGQHSTGEFVYNGNVKDIKSITASCGCTTTSKIKDGKLSFNIRFGKIPSHLDKISILPVEKYIDIKYNNGDKDRLIIRANILK